MHSRLFFFLLVVFFHKRLGICIFRKGVVSEVYWLFYLIWKLYFFPYFRLIIAYKVNVITVDAFIFLIIYRFFLDYFNLSVFLALGCCLALQEITSEISFLELLNRALPNFSLFQL